MRSEPSILHVDLDAFFAAVEQRDKPSLRGRPVVVGGLGPRGVVSTASYEARRFGVRSAMSMAQARALCPHAAFLAGRFDAYRETSATVIRVLREMSPLVEPVSLDEAYVDLSPVRDLDLTETGLRTLAQRLKDRVRRSTGGLGASVGIASSKLVAKVASDLDKPDGLVVVPSGSEQGLLRPLSVAVIPGVGPATTERLRRVGVRTVAELQGVGEAELVRLLGHAHGQLLHRLARAQDDRPVVADRESKSVSVEDTFGTDLVDPHLLASIVERHARRVCERLRAARISGRTVTVKVRLHDFSTHTRSATLPGPTDAPRVVVPVAVRLLGEVDTSAGVRLLGVGVSGLADWIQQDLFADDGDGPGHGIDHPADRDAHHPAEPADRTEPDPATRPSTGPAPSGHGPWAPGMDVTHAELGPGWVWGAGLGRVTVRFETRDTPPGPVRTFAADDPALARAPSPATVAGTVSETP